MLDIVTPNSRGQIWRPAPGLGVEVHRWSFGANGERRSPRIKAPHFHADYQLGVVAAGELKNTSHQRTTRLGAGQFYAIAPGEVHTEALGSAEAHFEFALLPPALLDQCVADLTEGRHPALAVPALTLAGSSSNQRTAPYFRAYLRAVQAGATALEQETHLLALAARLHAGAGAALPAPAAPAGSPAVRLVREYLTDCCPRRVSLTELAGLAHVSKYHLLRCFTREVGMPIHAFQLQLKLARARQLLRAGLDVLTVAVELDFVDQAHFSKFFKRGTSQTPGQFIRA